MRKVLEECPSCGKNLIITRMCCSDCETAVEGFFMPCRFCRLSEESLKFLEIFVKNRGNIKNMERELDISYPTVRNRLNAVIEELGYEVEAESDEELSENRREILRQLDAGEITAEAAAEMLNQLK